VCAGIFSGGWAQVVGDDGEVGCGEVEGKEFGGGDPAEGGVFVGVRGGAVGGEADDERDEFDGHRRVGVGVRGQRAEEGDGDVEFFTEFAMERGFGGFAGLDFAAGKFPFSAEVFVRGALGHEHVAVAFDEGADDAEGRTEIGHSDFMWKAGNQEGRRQGKRGIGPDSFPDFLISTFNSGVLGLFTMAKSAADDPRSFISQVSLVGRGGGAFKTLRGFDKSRHTVPDAVNNATSGFLAKLCAPELGEEAEAFFQRARAELSYKRKDVSLDVTSPVAVLSAKDFTLEIAYALEAADPSSYAITRTLHSIKTGDLLRVAEFDALFAGQFSAIAFALKKGVRVEAVIDAVEGLEDEAELRVDYPSDCSECTLRVDGIGAAVVCDGATLEMRFEKSGSPRELVEAFAAVRKAFALTKVRVLAGLL
jgi:hypothetical protein